MASNALAVVGSGGVIAPASYAGAGLSRDQVELLKSTVAKGATDDELRLFAEVCKKKGLDPFSKQIYAIKRWDADTQRETMTFQVGIDGFRLQAERTGRYEGQEPYLWCGQDGKWVDVWLSDKAPAAAKVTVYKKGFSQPSTGVALYREYVQTKKDGTPIKMWVKMCCNQLGKCAEALALRKAFPEELSGIYCPEEMQQADSEGVAYGTQAAADAVAERKLAEMQQRQTAQQVGGKSPDYYKMLEAFSKLKKTKGSATYYRGLGMAGYEHANQIPDTSTGRKVYAQINAMDPETEPVQQPQPQQQEPQPAAKLAEQLDALDAGIEEAWAEGRD